jgi:hypothetical protein
MADAKYLLSLPADTQAFFKGLQNTNINECSGKTAIMALNLAQRRPFKAFTKSGGKFHNKSMIADEIKRLLKLKPISLAPLPCCDFCQKPVEEDDQSWSKDRTLCIHMDCDGDWERVREVPFPYQHDSESEAESEAEPEAPKPEAKLWKAPWGKTLWRLAQGDAWHSDNDCWEVVNGEFFNYNTTPYLGKYDENEEEVIHGSRPRDPAHRFVS